MRSIKFILAVATLLPLIACETEEVHVHGDKCLSGSCKCPDNCKAGCNEDSSCKCPDNCKAGCNEDGSCKCPDNCKAGCNEDGSCKCPDNCKEGCNEDGSCKCPKECINGCQNDSLGICLPIDSNHNHMDDKYETAPKQGVSCRKYADCDSSIGKADGFCDSFIGYKCSTLCTSDTQCTDLNGGGYHYVCRSDGRCAPDEFVMDFEIKDNDLNLKIGLSGDNYVVDWGDGTQTNNTTTHDYNFPGRYTVSIKGKNLSYSRTHDYGNKTGNDRLKLIGIKAFGPVKLEYQAFHECENLLYISQIDIPDSDKLTTTHDFFKDVIHFNQPVEQWDVHNVTDMGSMFKSWIPGAGSAFNQPLNRWDVSKVEEMERMFEGATAFNQPLNNWETSNVRNMPSMFKNATSFNQDLSEWNVSKVSYMNTIFEALCDRIVVSG